MDLKKSFSIVLTIVMIAGCSKDKITGSGSITSQERNVTGFSGVVANGSTDAFINIDTGFIVTVKGYENLLSSYETTVSNGVLTAGFKDNVNVSNDNTELDVTLPLLDYVETSGDGDVTVTGEVSGSDHLKTVVNGAANISVEQGNADEFEGDLSGMGNIFALGFQCRVANVKISGDGSVEISVSDTLNVSISGNGKVYYHGSPVIITNITGNGQVIPK